MEKGAPCVAQIDLPIRNPGLHSDTLSQEQNLKANWTGPQLLETAVFSYFKFSEIKLYDDLFLNKLKLEINVEQCRSPPPQLNQSEMKQKTHNLIGNEEFICLQLEREK